MTEEFIKFLAYDNNNLIKDTINIPLSLDINYITQLYEPIKLIFNRINNKFTTEKIDFIDTLLWIINECPINNNYYRYEIYNNDKSQFCKIIKVYNDDKTIIYNININNVINYNYFITNYMFHKSENINYQRKQQYYNDRFESACKQIYNWIYLIYALTHNEEYFKSTVLLSYENYLKQEIEFNKKLNEKNKEIKELNKLIDFKNNLQEIEKDLRETICKYNNKCEQLNKDSHKLQDEQTKDYL